MATSKTKKTTSTTKKTAPKAKPKTTRGQLKIRDLTERELSEVSGGYTRAAFQNKA